MPLTYTQKQTCTQQAYIQAIIAACVGTQQLPVPFSALRRSCSLPLL